jgi:hypothetical protein
MKQLKNKLILKDFIRDYCNDKNIRRKVLILLEFPEQVKDCFEWIEEIQIEKKIIVLSPFAMNEMGDLPFNIIEDYYDLQELYCMGISNYQKVENLCEIIDANVQQSCPLLKELNITPSLFSFLDLKVVYDAATIRIFQLRKLIDAEKPDFIFFYGTEKYPFGIHKEAPYLFFNNKESIYSHLLALDCWKVPVVMLPAVPQMGDFYVGKENDQHIINILKQKVAWWLRFHPELLEIVINIKNNRWIEVYNGLKSHLTKNKSLPVLLIGGVYNWDDAISEIQSIKVGPIFRVEDVLKYRMNSRIYPDLDLNAVIRGWEKLKADNKFRDFFLFNDVDFFTVIEERFQFLIEHLIHACVNAYTETDFFLKEKNIKAIISSALVSCLENSMARAAHNAHIPVITWQHGSYGFHDSPIIIYTDLKNSNYHFVFGNGVEERYSTQSERCGTELIPIGSASLDKLSQKSKDLKLNCKEKKIVLYVLVNTFCENHLYISWEPPWSDNILWRSQMAILDVLGEHNDNTVIIKKLSSPLHRENPVCQYIEKKKYKNCQIIANESRFVDLLSKADIIVIDFPTTPLLESLTTSKPIFLYTGLLKIDDYAEQLLKQRVFCYKELPAFCESISKFLETGRIIDPVDYNNTEFLKRYGTHLNDGKSSIRAAQTLKDIVMR